MMVVRKARKIRKQRGYRTHGYGRISGGHRKSGTRGGKGAAGRYDHEFVRAIKAGTIFPKGFVPHRGPQKTIIPYNVGKLNSQIDKLAEDKLAEKKGNAYSIDLSKIGVVKLLGSGIVSHKIDVVVERITPKAQQKIEAAGGSVKKVE